MTRWVFVGSLLTCVIAIGLSQIRDPGIFGIESEPSRILFYGGSGLLAGVAGLISVLSGLYLGTVHLGSNSERSRRLLTGLMTVVLLLIGLLLARRLLG